MHKTRENIHHSHKVKMPGIFHSLKIEYLCSFLNLFKPTIKTVWRQISGRKLIAKCLGRLINLKRMWVSTYKLTNILVNIKF